MTVPPLGIIALVDSSLSSLTMPFQYQPLGVVSNGHHAYTSPDFIRTVECDQPHSTWAGVVSGDEQSRNGEMSRNGLPQLAKLQTVELGSKVIAQWQWQLNSKERIERKVVHKF